MKNNELVKENLFELRKIIFIERDFRDEIICKEEVIGIITPSFDNYNKKFNEDESYIIGLNGKTYECLNNEFIIENTTITNDDLKAKVNEIIAFAKENYNFQKEKVEFYRNIKKREEMFNKKTDIQERYLNNMLSNIKKEQGILSYKEIIKSLEEILKQYSKNFRASYNNIGGIYTASIDNSKYLFEASILEDKVRYIKITKSILVEESIHSLLKYDFIKEDWEFYKYGYVLNEFDFCNSKYFKKLKKQYFKSNALKVLDPDTTGYNYSYKVKEEFSANLDIYDLYVSHSIEYNCSKYDIKEVNNKLHDLLSFMID